MVIYKKLVEKKKKILNYLIKIEKVNEYEIEKIKVYIKKKPKIIKEAIQQKEHMGEIRRSRKYKRDSRRI